MTINTIPEARKWLFKNIVRATLLLIFILTVVSIPHFFSKPISEYLVNFADNLSKFELRKVVVLNSSAYMFLLVAYLIVFLITSAVFRFITNLKIFGGILFSLFISSLAFIYFWYKFEFVMWTEYLIRTGDSIRSIQLDLFNLVIVTGAMYTYTILFGFCKLAAGKGLSNFMNEVFIYIESFKSKFDL